MASLFISRGPTMYFVVSRSDKTLLCIKMDRGGLLIFRDFVKMSDDYNEETFCLDPLFQVSDPHSYLPDHDRFTSYTSATLFAKCADANLKTAWSSAIDLDIRTFAQARAAVLKRPESLEVLPFRFRDDNDIVECAVDREFYALRHASKRAQQYMLREVGIEMVMS